MKKGLFITFEGIDGSGKTTQLGLIKSYLEDRGFKTVSTFEPGALDAGKEIRRLLLNNSSSISDRCEMFLFLADRANHADMLIKPAIEEGTIVLCDRYIDSTLAYQGYARGQEIELLKKLNDIAISGIIPDLTLLYDISAESAAQRMCREKDRMEAAGLEFQKKVRNGYLELQKEEAGRIKIINAEKPVQEVFKQAESIIDRLLQEKKGE